MIDTRKAVCPICGVRQAFAAAGFSQEIQDEVITKIYQVTSSQNGLKQRRGFMPLPFSLPLAIQRYIPLVPFKGVNPGHAVVHAAILHKARGCQASPVIDGKQHFLVIPVRRRRIGYVFQNYQLLPALTVRENIVFPLRLSGQRAGGQEVEGLARMLGIESCLNTFPGRLSGGQQQRVAIARALIHHPQIILADEPTGNLDSRNAAEILNIFSYLNQCGTTILMVTHNPNIAAMCQRRFLVSDGCCTELA